MTIEEIIVESYRKRVFSPTAMVAWAAKRYGKKINLPSLNTLISRMRREGRLPKRERKSKPNFFRDTN